MFKVTALILSLMIGVTHAQVDTWADGIIGGPIDQLTGLVGSESRCLSANQDEYEYVDCEIETYTYQNPQLRSDFDHMTEELIFMEATRRTHQLTVCQGKLHKKYAQDPATRSTLLQNTFIQFNAVQQRLGELARRKDEVEGRVQMYSRTDPDDRFNYRLTEWRLERLKPAQEELAQVKSDIQALVSRIPMGNRPDMHEMLVNLAKNNGSVNQAQFNESFDGVMGKLQQDVYKSTQFFDKIIRPRGDGGIIYSVNNDLKTALVKAGQVENVVTSLGMEERLADRFVCRSRARYVDGPRNLSLIEIPFYFAGAYGLGRLALRAGVYALRTGSTAVRAVAAGTRAAAQLGMVGLSGYQLARGADQSYEACFPPEFLNGQLDEQCTEETEVTGIYQEASIAQCVTTTALTLAPPAFVGVSGIVRKVLPTGIPQMSRALANSGKFRFFQAGRREVPFTDQTLQPGVSYTVVFDDEGRVVLGSNYRNEGGGFAGTHVMLWEDVRGQALRGRPYEGGTIRVNQDGSIDISGFRRKDANERSMRLIENAVREVLPGATIRSTPGRLPN